MADGRVASTIAPVPFAVVATAGIVGGGLLSAVTAHDASRVSAWATAYLVLVVGVAQYALGAGQALLAPRSPTRNVLLVECLLWNTGNVGVLLGTLLGRTLLVDGGSILLLAALALFTRQVRGARLTGWVGNGYRLLIVVLLCSVPIGLVLARV